MDFVKSHLDLEKSEPKVFNWSVSFFRSDFLQNPYFNVPVKFILGNSLRDFIANDA